MCDLSLILVYLYCLRSLAVVVALLVAAVCLACLGPFNGTTLCLHDFRVESPQS